MGIVWFGIAITDVQVNVVMLGCDTAEVIAQYVLVAVANAVEEPRLALGGIGNDGVEHAEHRCNAYPATDEHNRVLSG